MWNSLPSEMRKLKTSRSSGELSAPGLAQSVDMPSAVALEVSIFQLVIICYCILKPHLVVFLPHSVIIIIIISLLTWMCACMQGALA